MPTVDVAPAAWKVPGRVALPCVLVLTLTIGLATFRLSWTWAAEDLALAGLCNTLLKPGPIPPTPIELPAMREPRWWSTTSGHLLLRALAARFGMPAPDRVGESHGLLEMAHGLSPLDRSVRLNLIASGAGRAPFGVSRDAVALHLQGNRLRDAGRNDEAVACYARALAIAATSEPEDAPSHFFEDPLARFALPLEGRMTEIVRDLLIACRDAPDRWAEALPSSPLAALAAFRILRDERDPSAARAGELVLESGDPEDGVPGALRLAAQGEVLALEGRLPEAAERYREAISRELPEAIRRLLAFNLSDIEARLGNHRAMVEAWDLARGADLHDPINVRLAEARIRRSRSLPATPGVRGKAATDAVLRATHERPAPFRP